MNTYKTKKGEKLHMTSWAGVLHIDLVERDGKYYLDCEDKPELNRQLSTSLLNACRQFSSIFVEELGKDENKTWKH